MRAFILSLALLPSIAIAQLPTPGTYKGALGRFKCTNCDAPKKISRTIKLRPSGRVYILQHPDYPGLELKKKGAISVQGTIRYETSKTCVEECTVGASRGTSTGIGYAEGCFTFCDLKYSTVGYSGKMYLRTRRGR